MLRRYIHGAGTDEPLVWYEGSGTTDRRWLHTDHLGSVMMETNASGARLNRYTYGSWGEPGTSGWTGSRFRYTGQITLPEAQLYHYKARVYDPMFGRFMQTDPIGYSDDYNLYAYAGDDPVNATDPSGEVVVVAPVVVYGLAAASAGAAACYIQECVTNFLRSAQVVGGMAIERFRHQMEKDKAAGRTARAPPIPDTKGNPDDPDDPDDNDKKRDHLFDKADHNLGKVIEEQGGRREAYRAVRNAARAVARQAAGPSGRYEVTVRVGSQNVTVRGKVVGNQVRIGTAFVR